MDAFSKWWQRRNYGNVKTDSGDEDLARIAFIAGLQLAREVNRAAMNSAACTWDDIDSALASEQDATKQAKIVCAQTPLG